MTTLLECKKKADELKAKRRAAYKKWYDKNKYKINAKVKPKTDELPRGFGQ